LKSKNSKKTEPRMDTDNHGFFEKTKTKTKKEKWIPAFAGMTKKKKEKKLG